MKKILLLVMVGFFLVSCASLDFGVNQDGNTNLLGSGNKALTAEETKLQQLLISDVFDDMGTVSENKTSYGATTPEIGVSAYIMGAHPGLKVTADLTYLPSGDKVGPVTNVTQTAGDIISNFSFSKPTNNWPSGEYEVKVTLEDGQVLAVKFNVP